ncbi:tRNA intron endonuclease, catalytic protein [Ancylostoma duodenale]|uniref:tRNA-intron lyase n=1 Tax=Ancylostoma duodenale TaxID=51022 RepID=A0A0C2DNY6_9BILA|nr:tRNA intron endonuclease, catalytic protein [Ancylostoma duodenale]
MYNFISILYDDTHETDDNLYRWLDDYEIPVPSTREFRARELVYHDLWRKGYYLTSGEQFGSAWLVYEGLPGDVHAKFLCEFVLDDENLSPLNLISLVRVATQVKLVFIYFCSFILLVFGNSLGQCIEIVYGNVCC